MADDNLLAAKLLLDRGHPRSAVSRAYYAAYAALTQRLANKKIQFGYGGNHPSHEQLLALVTHNLSRHRFGEESRRFLHRSLKRLQSIRVLADDSPRDVIAADIARNMVRLSSMLVELAR